MRPAKYRHPITIKRSVSSRGSQFREAKISWETFLETRAEFVQSVGAETQGPAKVEAGATTILKIRYAAGITPKMMVVFNGRELQLVSTVNVGERNLELILTCKEKIH